MPKTEVMNNQLAVMVKEAGLAPTKAKYILEKFQDYFEIASEWETKARMIKVTNASQVTEMQMARVGRLFLKEKRCAIETARKELKEQALREGKAIDGVANVLKALIVPIEDYLDKQERFVEIQEEEKREVIRLEVEKRIEDERIAKEKADAEALEKARLENEKLRAEAIEREQKAQVERKKQEALLAKERADAEKKHKEAELELKKAGEKAAAKLAKEKKEKEKLEADLKAQKEEAMEKAQVEKEKARAKLEAERKEKERLEEMLKNQIECPKCHFKFSLIKEN